MGETWVPSAGVGGKGHRSNARQGGATGTWHWRISTDELAWSTSAEAALGFAPGALGLTLSSFLSTVHPDDREAVGRCAEAVARDGSSFEIEFRIQVPERSVRRMLCTGEAARDAGGRVTFVVGRITDVTAQGDASHDRDDVLVLLAAAEERLDCLEARVALAAEFTALAAHELDLKIAAVRARAAVIATDELSDDQRRRLADLLADADGLHELVAQVRLAAALEDADFAVCPRPVSVATLVADAVPDDALHGDHPVRAVTTASGEVWADRWRINQVLRNLLDNAAKYSPPGTPIELRVRPVGRDVRFEVADHGPGVPVEDRDRVFGKFCRGSGWTSGAVPGRGLGLYLSRRIIESHGGTLSVASPAGQGAVLCFSLEAVP